MHKCEHRTPALERCQADTLFKDDFGFTRKVRNRDQGLFRLSGRTIVLANCRPKTSTPTTQITPMHTKPHLKIFCFCCTMRASRVFSGFMTGMIVRDMRHAALQTFASSRQGASETRALPTTVYSHAQRRKQQTHGFCSVHVVVTMCTNLSACHPLVRLLSRHMHNRKKEMAKNRKPTPRPTGHRGCPQELREGAQT